MPRIPEQFKCDHPGCEAVRSQTNHWWQANTHAGSFEVWPWDDTADNVPGIQFYCGQEHLLAALSRWAGEVGGEK